MTWRIAHHGEALTSESPVWDAGRATLWYIDIQGQRLFGYRPADARARSVMLPSMPGFVVPDAYGGLILGLEDGLWVFDPDTGAMSRRIEVESGDQRTRINEGKADAAGRLWFGSMDKTGAFGPIGSLYCYDAAKGVRRIRSEVGVPNALDTSPDGAILYFADTAARVVEAYPMDAATGELGSPRALKRYPDGEAPDGLTVAADGTLWLAVVGGGRIDHLDPSGASLGAVQLPVSRPTAPTFGGADLSTLYVTSQRRFLGAEDLAREPAAGALIEVPGCVRGRPPFAARIA